MYSLCTVYSSKSFTPFVNTLQLQKKLAKKDHVKKEKRGKGNKKGRWGRVTKGEGGKG